MHINIDNSSWRYWVDYLQLKPHPEGGFYRETYRSEGSISRTSLPEKFKGDRNFSTAIYYLMKEGDFSAFHRIASDEVWHFYQGSSLSVFVIHPDGTFQEVKLGDAPRNNEVFQAVVPAGSWFASKPTRPDSWSLVGCTVSPGFDFEDFEMANRKELLKEFPQHQAIIEELTRE